jgi:hypothetical protein
MHRGDRFTESEATDALGMLYKGGGDKAERQKAYFKKVEFKRPNDIEGRKIGEKKLYSNTL